MNEESRPARRLPDNSTAPSIADGAASFRAWQVPPPRELRVSREERAWLSSLDDNELARHVRGLTSIDRSVKSAHRAAEKKRAA